MIQSTNRHISKSSNQFRGSSSVDRALAFQAEGRGFESRLPLSFFRLCSSVVEHFLGKEEVVGSIPAIGSSKIWRLIKNKAKKGSFVLSFSILSDSYRKYIFYLH